jgi:hypothetical protein
MRRRESLTGCRTGLSGDCRAGNGGAAREADVEKREKSRKGEGKLCWDREISTRPFNEERRGETHRSRHYRHCESEEKPPSENPLVPSTTTPPEQLLMARHFSQQTMYALLYQAGS